MSQQEPIFEDDIRPLFRSNDIESMSGLFDLSSYQDVRSNDEKIYEKLSNGSMPCDGAWPAERCSYSRAGSTQAISAENPPHGPKPPAIQRRCRLLRATMCP